MPSSVMRNVLVTGGRGFIGRHLVSTLRRCGVEVATLGRQPDAASPYGSHYTLSDSDWRSHALDRILVETAPDCIFHLAGIARGAPEELSYVNVDLFKALSQALRRTGLNPRVVVVGSAAEYGAAIRDGEPVSETTVCAPVSAYGVSKYEQTQAALAYADLAGASVLVARVFNPIGPHMPPHLALGDFARQIAAMPFSGGVLRVGNVDVRRDMIDVEHAATMLYRLADNADAVGVVNICSGQAPMLRELVELLIEAYRREVEVVVDWERVRGNEPRTIVGSTARLRRLGCPPPPTEFQAVISRLSCSLGVVEAHS